MDSPQIFSIQELLAVLARRGRLLASVAGATLLLVFWISMALTNQFRAESLILVEPQGVSDELVAAGVRESDLSQRLGIMSSEILSRARLSKVITDLNLYEDMADWYTREEIVDFMRDRLSVLPVFTEFESGQRRNRDMQFNTFRIGFSYESPGPAAEVVNRLANDFISEHINARVQVSQKSLDFMRASIEGLRAQLVEVEAEIARIKKENAGRLPEDLLGNQRMQQQATSDLRAAQQALSAAVSDEAFWKNQVIAAVSLANPNDRTDPAYRKKQLRLQLSEMRARGFTDRHPDVIIAQAELDSIEENERQNADAASSGIEKAPETYAEQNAQSEYRRAGLRAAAAKEEVARLQVQLGEIEMRIASTPAVAEQLDALRREYDSLYKSFQSFSGKLQQATVQADMERRQLGEQLLVLEAAYPPPAPTSPNRPLILVLGLVLGLGLGVVVVVLVETGDRSVHSARELQQISGIPVLADIPSIMLESDRVDRARRIVREVVLVAAIVVFCLVGGLVTYFVVNGAPGFLQTPAVEEAEADRGQAALKVEARGTRSV